jgi:hypothetical protein
MNKADFQLADNPYGEPYAYEADLGDFKIEIDTKVFSDENIELAQKIIEAYPDRLSAIAAFCLESDEFQAMYPDETVESIIEKLHYPIVKIDSIYTMLTYCAHELDDIHLLDVIFDGVIENFRYVGIDG